MFKRITALVLATLLALSCAACSKEPEPTEPPVASIPTNTFRTQHSDLNYILIDGQSYRLDADFPNSLVQNGYKHGTDDTATALYLGYPKNDAKYLYYQYDQNSINCVYCCVIGETMTVTVSYRVIEPSQLGIESAYYSTANHLTTYANYIDANKQVDEVLTYLGEPDSAETNSSGFITKLIYKNKNAEGKIDNKLEIEFVAERVYKITIVKNI